MKRGLPTIEKGGRCDSQCLELSFADASRPPELIGVELIR